MSKRRSRGDGGLYWSEQRKRWIAEITIGYTPAGKRIVRKASGETKTEALNKLKDKIRDYEDGLAVAPSDYTVENAVRYWLDNGLKGRSENTATMNRRYAEKHLIPAIGKRKLRDLSVEDVDKWLAGKTAELSTRSLKILHNILNRSVKSAMARDKVKRNIVELCEVPEGREGRLSKALSLDQAEAVLKAAADAPIRMHAYIVLSLLTGARTEELRALRWTHVVAFDDERAAWLPVSEAGWEHQQMALYVWRSVRKKGDTKTTRSRRSLQLPDRCVDVLQKLHEEQRAELSQGATWDSDTLVFRTKAGSPLAAGNVRRDFRKVLKRAGLVAKDWAPRELRHSFVSLLSAHDVPIEHISRLVGHRNTIVTETVYRQQIRPTIQEGATAMNLIFPKQDQKP